MLLLVIFMLGILLGIVLIIAWLIYIFRNDQFIVDYNGKPIKCERCHKHKVRIDAPKYVYQAEPHYICDKCIELTYICVVCHLHEKECGETKLSRDDGNRYCAQCAQRVNKRAPRSNIQFNPITLTYDMEYPENWLIPNYLKTQRKWRVVK